MQTVFSSAVKQL